MNKNEESKSALKATGTVGGGQIINIFISLLRNKVIALVLGATGIGIVGILTTATDTIRNFASLGIPFSGVRDISISHSKNDELEVAKIVKIFNKWIFISALLGSVITILFCLPLSWFLFKNDNYAIGISFLALLVFFSTLGSGYQSVMQGMRELVIMSKATIIGNFFGSIMAVLLYLILGKQGIIPSLVIMGFINFFVAYFYYKRLRIANYGKVLFSESWASAKVMIKIGFFTIIVSVFDQLVALALRGFLSNKSGIEGVGLFTAANTIATMYLSIVLNSMASDYYPKLSSIHKDNDKIREAVNSQLFIVLLLASPIIIGMVGFADVAINILYSNKFSGAVSVLKWQVIGDFFKIIAWPLGFVFLAKGLGKLYVFTSISYTIIYIGFVYFGWDYLGFLSIGLSFCIAQFLSMLFTCIYCYNIYHIKITQNNLKIIFVFSFLLFFAFCIEKYFVGFYQFFLLIIVVFTSLLFSIYHLNSVLNVKGVITKIFKRS